MKTVACLLALFCATSFAHANQPTAKEKSIENRLENSSLAKNPAYQSVYIYLMGTHSDVELGNISLLSRVLKVSLDDLENKREEILAQFEAHNLKKFPRKIVHVSIESFSEAFASEEAAKQGLKVTESKQLNQKHTTRLLEDFRIKDL